MHNVGGMSVPPESTRSVLFSVKSMYAMVTGMCIVIGVKGHFDAHVTMHTYCLE